MSVTLGLATRHLGQAGRTGRQAQLDQVKLQQLWLYEPSPDPGQLAHAKACTAVASLLLGYACCSHTHPVAR